MEYTKRIEQKEQNLTDAFYELRKNFGSWRPAYKNKENLENLKKLRFAMQLLQKEIDKQK